MKTHETELSLIKDLLGNNPKGMKITRIARELSMNRNACAKFIEILLMTGQVEQIEHGMSKIIILSRRTGIPTMLDRSEDFIIILDQAMRICRVNDNFLNFSGMNREEILGKRPDTAGLPIIGRNYLFDRIREAHYGTDIRTEVQETIGGREFFFDVRITPTIFNDGMKGITIIIGDVTRGKKDLAEARDESRQLVEGILSCIEDAVVLLDSRTGDVLFVNPAAEKMFGHPPAKSGERPSRVLPGIAEMVPGYPGKLREAFRERPWYEAESRMKRDGIGEIPVNLLLRPVCNSEGEIRNIVMVIRARDCPAGPAIVHRSTGEMLPQGFFSPDSARRFPAT